MEKKTDSTCMKIEFLFISNHCFSFDDVTRKLGISPTSSTQQDLRYEDTPRIEYAWEFATEKTLSLEDLFKEITDIFLKKQELRTHPLFSFLIKERYFILKSLY